MNKLILVALLIFQLRTSIYQKTVSVFGFGNFCYDGECYKNPSAAMALRFGGSVVRADWDSVNNLRITGPSVGIGLDYSAKSAYVNGTALGYQSTSVSGPDAGDYFCGVLFAKALIVNPCSAFVHLPLHPSKQDIEVVRQVIESVRSCSEVKPLGSVHRHSLESQIGNR